MSIAKAISSAMSGLTATARGTETVAANLSNVMTPGYARRDMQVSSQTVTGGVRVDGIARIVNSSLLTESRLAGSALSAASTKNAFQVRMEATVGLPGQTGSLGTALNDFQVALGAAATRPDDDLRLAQVVATAGNLANRLNDASTAVQEARSTAQQGIASDVAVLNASLERVAYLNARIAVLDADGTDASPLMDERQQVIDRIAGIVPVQEVTRDAGRVALFTAEGAVLLDGSLPARIEFQGASQATAGQTVGAPLQLLTFNGTPLSQAQMRLFSGGSLQANFQIRDQLGPDLQADLDALAFDLQERLSGPQVDPTLAAGDAGLFTDQGAKASVAGITGLAGRLTLNAALDGAAWRLRDGLQAAAQGPVGASGILNGMIAALDAARAPTSDGLQGTATLGTRFGTLEAKVSTGRVNSDADLAIRSSRQSTIQSSILADGVDSDAEMQKLLQYEQSYAANARVLRAVDEMLDQILGI
ncbi:flagellar hook-associated protein FlgK [Paracoccus sediminilitoris]|uniref:flagellar hook-associated protein FlgK n=1 Tax=Paracoccus sediminilitoris TaxID=2202419 RepID=UPI00272AAB52|nr:flagellar hook-associated protein FlgK [Paracoccus sediminilitoris]